MKEDYLWDKSGEVDDEIEQLENMLGSLRYRRPAEPLPLPSVSRPRFRLNSTWLAVAAAIVLLLLMGGIWLKLRYPSSNAVVSGPAPPTGPVNPAGGPGTVAGNQQPNKPVSQPAPQNVVIPRAPGERKQFVAVKYSEMKRARERREEQIIRRGELAKEQLIKALQITSEKLNTAQKKIQGAQESGPVS